MADTLSGIIERITFHNLDNGYCVLRVQARGHRDLVTVVGHVSQVIAGEFIEASGTWVQDRNHGQQFKADELRSTPPHTPSGIAKYLGSGLVNGIGPRYAQKIVDVFGERTLEIIDQSPSSLLEIKGIGARRVALIRDSWKQNQAVHRIMAFLQSFGVGTARAVRIYKLYGENAIDQVRQNPYRLSTDIWGIGFRTADELALKLGIPRDSPQRAQAAVRHVLQEAAHNGHVGLPEPILSEEAQSLATLSADNVLSAIEALIREEELIRDGVRNAKGDSETPETLIYLKTLFHVEQGLARATLTLVTGNHPLPDFDREKAVEWVESKMEITFAEAQREAVRSALTQKLLVLTGGPGTGKTTIVRAILEIFEAKRQRVILAAPTGRAAKRLGESTGREAKTIHRVLEFDPGIGGFRRTRDNPLELDLLIVDEVSMADVALMNQLLRAVPAYAAVLFVGDVDQLPSVGPGNVLGDLINSGVVPVVRLTQVHRQASSSYIIRAAHAVNSGEMPDSAPAGEGDFYFIEAAEPALVIERLITMVRDRIPQRFGLDPLRDIQVLTPMNRSELGVANLNQVLQEAMNPSAGKKEVQRFGMTYRLGDKVIQTQNNYQREVYNGDIGRITDVDVVEQFVTVEFDGRAVDYDFGDLDELQLAYATSIHKSQGSEYPAVLIPVHTQHFVMLQRNLLYTGITRGRKLVVLVGTSKALWIAVNKGERSHRYSLLRERLQGKCGA